MKKVRNLYGVKATVLPARVMVLLSKYAQAIKDNDGVVIQLSSLNVFKHVHNSYIRSQSPAVHKCYKFLLREVNHHLVEGNMLLSADDDLIAVSNGSAKPELDERYRASKYKSSKRTDYSETVLRSI